MEAHRPGNSQVAVVLVIMCYVIGHLHVVDGSPPCETVHTRFVY
jgi:hypothetical protein